MKIAVYNRYWTTGGGGERYAGAFAQALASEHDVDLLTPEPVDWDALTERLALDLSHATPRLVEEEGYGSLARATAGYDLLVSCSYMSSEPNGARRGIYVVLFPTPFDHELGGARRIASRLLRIGADDEDPRLEWGRGFYPPEWSRRGRYRWTAGTAHLLVRAAEGERVPVHLSLRGGRPPEVGSTDVHVEADGREVGHALLGAERVPTSLRFEVEGRGGTDPVIVTIRSSPFVPRDSLATSDSRELGIQLRSVTLGAGLGPVLRGFFPRLAVPPVPLDFLDTYTRIVSISEFTRSWVRELWNRESEILHPPVPLRATGEKEPLILSVGRFFGRDAGHSKKQLELVRTFRSLVEDGLTGWEYHLVGGCSPEHLPYLEEVRREAHGLPVRIHVDASGAELDALYRRASIFWHAAGLGENERRRPWRLEHFGITTVEAMATGAVPVVVGRAGQREIVEHGVSGFHIDSVRELAERTRELVEDESLRRRLGAGARRRAEAFSADRFAERARSLVRETLAQP
jgi:glycosyltransferase involved in cell wall biosynthesis